MIVRQLAPHPRLADIVRHYQSRTAEPGEAARRIALPARTDVLLEFYFTAPHLLELQTTGALERAPRVAAVGPQTYRRVDLILSGRMDIFTIHFTPTGLHALLGVPMTQVTDAGIDAAALFGTDAIGSVYDHLGGATDFDARARIADAFLLSRRSGRPASPVIAAALMRIGRGDGADRARLLARDAGLSERQFRRVFAEHIGVAPKKYARIVRLEAALAIRRAVPGMGWTSIAHDCGWFDQAHMDKDFVALAGATPTRFVAATPA